MEFIDYFGCLLIAAFAAFILGMVVESKIGDPTELENGCIVYEDKVYCEEVNEVGG